MTISSLTAFRDGMIRRSRSRRENYAATPLRRKSETCGGEPSPASPPPRPRPPTSARSAGSAPQVVLRDPDLQNDPDHPTGNRDVVRLHGGGQAPPPGHDAKDEARESQVPPDHGPSEAEMRNPGPHA